MLDSAVHERTGRRLSGLWALIVYVACLLAFQAYMVLAEALHLPQHTGVGAYLALGFLLNRLVLRNLVQWHPMTNNLQTVTNSKIWALIAWPFAYGMLLVRMFINWLL